MNNKIKNICVYCSSSDAVDKAYFNAAEKLGAEIGSRGLALVYGGAKVGLMGELAKSAESNGAYTIGIMPEILKHKEIVADFLSELIYTDDLRTRKAEMEKRADAFIAMPGGFGTLDEIFEILIFKQLGYHSKPVVFLNTNNFYGDLFSLFEKIYNEKFAKRNFSEQYFISSDLKKIFNYFDNYNMVEPVRKWW